MFTKISFRNVVFIVLCVIFTLYAIDVIDINPKLIPLLLIVSIYLLTCKNWNIFSKENREEFSEDSKGTLIIPGNLKVEGKITTENIDVENTLDTKILNVKGNSTLGTAENRSITTFNKLQHWSGDGKIHRDDNKIFTIESDNKIKMNGVVDVNNTINVGNLTVNKNVYVTGTLNVKSDSTFNGHLTVANGKHIYHKNNSKSIYGVGEAKTNSDDGTIGYEAKWGKGLSVVGIKDDTNGRVVRFHSNHLLNIGHIHPVVVKAHVIDTDQLLGHAFGATAGDNNTIYTPGKKINWRYDRA
jgi:cytoskeletal protein CcmA (bactofilin family)